MSESSHGFCPLHRCAYNRSLDPTCPQCMMARIVPPAQQDWDTVAHKPQTPLAANSAQVAK